MRHENHTPPLRVNVRRKMKSRKKLQFGPEGYFCLGRLENWKPPRANCSLFSRSNSEWPLWRRHENHMPYILEGNLLLENEIKELLTTVYTVFGAQYIPATYLCLRNWKRLVLFTAFLVGAIPSDHSERVMKIICHISFREETWAGKWNQELWQQRTPRRKGIIFQGDESVAADFPMKSPEESKNLTSSTQRKPDHDPQLRAGPKQTETNLGAQEQIDQGTNCLTASVLFNHCILSVGVVERPFFM